MPNHGARLAHTALEKGHCTSICTTISWCVKQSLVGTTSMFIDSVCRPNFILKNDPTEEEAFAFGFGVPPFVPIIVFKGPFKLHQVC
jgi:hypothetical protein